MVVRQETRLRAAPAGDDSTAGLSVRGFDFPGGHRPAAVGAIRGRTATAAYPDPPGARVAGCQSSSPRNSATVSTTPMLGWASRSVRLPAPQVTPIPASPAASAACRSTTASPT